MVIRISNRDLECLISLLRRELLEEENSLDEYLDFIESFFPDDLDATRASYVGDVRNRIALLKNLIKKLGD